MQLVLGILLAIFLFGIMIFLHELGHYAAARLCKVKVEEFAIGMGPAIFSHRSKKTDILYSLRLLPIGGFTAMLGEDEEVKKTDENGESKPDPRALTSRPAWQRLIVLFAGSFMNLFTGMLAIFIMVCMQPGYRNTTVLGFEGSDGKYYYETEAASSYAAGLRRGDRIVAVNGSSVADLTDLLNSVALEGANPVELTVIREGETVKIPGIRFPTDESEGVAVGLTDFVTEYVDYSFTQRLGQTFSRSVSTVKTIYKSLVKLITGQLGINGVSGPVGTVSTIGKSVASDEIKGYRLEYVLYLYSFISLNLGVMNLLPLPALDGGRIIFVLIEMIFRKPVKRKYEGLVHLVGMAVLLIFMAVITVLDVMKIVRS